MYQALFYKEWNKTKRIVFLIIAIFVGVIAYTFINAGQLFRVGGATDAWSMVIFKDMSVLPSIFTWIPVLTSLLLAFNQFVPEMTDKRLKLTLHLPMPETRTMTTMLLYGIFVLLGLYIASYVALIVGLSAYYPQEVICNMILKSLPWFLGGLTAYLLTSWICLEPTWRQRIYNGAISLCILSFFFIDSKSGAYTPIIPYLVIFGLIACFSFPFYSTARFKDGAL